MLPTLTAYLPHPSVATGAAVVVCPGGVFHYLAIEHEGTAVARWLCERGIAAFVLKYRVLQTAARDEDLAKQLQERFANLFDLMGLMQTIEPLAIADGQQEQVYRSIQRGEMPVARSNCISMLRVVMALAWEDRACLLTTG